MPTSSCAERILLIDRLAAGETARRQDAVKHGPADTPQPAGNVGGEGCPGVHRDTSSVREWVVNGDCLAFPRF